MQIIASDFTFTYGVRETVFCREQGYPLQKLTDSHDPGAQYLAVVLNGEAVGCARFFKKAADSWHMDNIALLSSARRSGEGRRLVEAVICSCKSLGAKSLTVNARLEAVGFYSKCGFSEFSRRFADENVIRQPMCLTLSGGAP